MIENRDRFDNAAKDWDKNQTRLVMAENISAQVLKNIPFDKKHIVMDFGCGTGLLGLTIAPLVGKLIGADLSSGMLESFDAKAKAQGFENVETLHLDVDGNFDMHEFDTIVSAMTVHHIREPHLLFAKFADSLKSGGYLGIADLAKEDGRFHDDNNGVYHFGFTKEEFTEFFVQNGFDKPQISVAHMVSKQHGNYEIYFCYAKKL